MNFIEGYLKMYHINMKELSIITTIPYRTIQNWKNDEREAPSYIPYMMGCTLTNVFGYELSRDLSEPEEYWSKEEYDELIKKVRDTVKIWTKCIK